MQSPMRHANSNIAMNIYAQAVSSEKRGRRVEAQNKVLE